MKPSSASCTKVVIALCCLLELFYFGQVNGREVRVNATDEVLLGTAIVDLKTTLLTVFHQPTSVVNTLTYMLLNSYNETMFTVDTTSGVVRALMSFDRDVLCPQQVTCLHKLDIAAHSTQQQQFFKINLLVELIDENDNSPRFDSQRVVLHVSESTKLGASLPIQPATDIDSPRNGIDRYQMIAVPPTSDNLPFNLNIQRSNDGSFELQLVLTDALDREQTDVYHVQLLAIDRGLPPRTGSTLIDVVVTDVNDNRPHFQQSVYEINIDETTSPLQHNITLLTVVADDADIGLNGQVQYSFNMKTEAMYGSLFHIDSNSGQITLTQSLDYEQPRLRTISLEVLAQDKGHSPSPVSTRVIVNVNDVNDNAPVMELTSSDNARCLSSSSDKLPCHLNVTEHSDNGTVIGLVSVTDKDTGRAGLVTCTMTEQPGTNQQLHFRLVVVDKGEYKLTTTEVPTDRETMARYQLKVTCKDNNGLGVSHSSQLFIDINIDDINDNAPQFSQSVYNATVKENAEPQEVIARVTASDKDTGVNGHVTYEIVSTKLFAIDPNSGDIWTNATFNREMVAQYQFQVIAYNKMTSLTTDRVAGAVQSGTSTAVVQVYIEDVNDQSPHFTHSNYVMNISENMLPGSVVGHVTAVDNDKPPHNKHSYHFQVTPSVESVQKLFQIDSLTGKITTKRMLDREDKSSYKLTVIARDDVIQTLFDTCDVTVYVTDVNDQSPAVKFPTPSNDTAYVSSDVVIGSHVTRILASDADDGYNAKLVYYIVAGNEHGLFRISAHSGDIFVNGSLTEYYMDTFRLEIAVKDSGTPQLDKNATLFIIIRPAPIVLENATPSKGFMQQLLQIPADRGLTILAIVVTISVVVILVTCLTICIVYRRHCIVKHVDKHSSQTSASGVPLKREDQQAAGASCRTTLLAPDGSGSAAVTAANGPPTPAASSIRSSLIHGATSSQTGRSSSSMNTGSLYLEDDIEHQWDSVLTTAIRPPSLPPCYNSLNADINGYCSRAPLQSVHDTMTSSLMSRRLLQQQPYATSNTSSGLTNTFTMKPVLTTACGGSDVTSALQPQHSFDRFLHVGGGSDLSRVQLSNGELTAPRISSHFTSGSMANTSPLYRGPIISDAAPKSDELSMSSAVSRKSSFSAWLNKESLQLHQNGHRYRVANDSNYHNSGGGTGDIHTYDVTTEPNLVGRTRLHSAHDVDTKEPRNVHFDDVIGKLGTVTSSSSGCSYGSLRKPINATCNSVSNAATTSERYISLG